MSFYAGQQKWMSELKKRSANSPLASNVFFGFILVILEKLVEMEFACPCDPSKNTMFVIALFILPAFLGFLLMCIIQIDKHGCVTSAVISLVPAIVWVTILFFDGHYFACIRTDWSGRYVTVDKAAPQKWCEPTNHDSSLELMSKTQQWFSESQVRKILISIKMFSYLSGMCLKWDFSL